MIHARIWLSHLPACTLLACAAPCEKVRDSHDAFRKATAPIAAKAAGDSQPHLSLAIPFEVLDRAIAKELGRVPTLKLPLPEILGASLGSLQLSVQSVRVRPAPAGELGVQLSLALREGKRGVLDVDVDARLRPRLDPGSGSVAVSLSGRDIIELRPSISKPSRKRLGDWVWSKLPGAAKAFVDRDAVGEVVGELAEDLMRDAVRELKRDLLDDLGTLVDFEFDLPQELPIRAIALSSRDSYLDIDLHTHLRVEHGLGPGHARGKGLDPKLIQARFSGDVMAALANHAIAEGRIPGRWTLEGEPNPKGEVHAGVGWADGQSDALEIHLWKFEGDCAYVILRGQPRLAVKGREVELGTERAKVQSVVGSAKVRAGLFLSKTARRGIALLERTAAGTEVEIGSVKMRAEIEGAEIVGDEVVIGVRLAGVR